MTDEQIDSRRSLPAVRGLPLGTEAAVVCDSCNAMIATEGDVEPGEDPGAAFLYITRDAGVWSSRWVNCEDCGPITAECDQDECVAYVQLALAESPNPTSFYVTEAEIAPDVRHAGDLLALRRPTTGRS
mgnify:CR=1 FL=1